MKLSEMNTEQLANTLCRIAAPIERIGKDEELNARLAEAAKANGGKTVLSNMASLIGMLVPPLLERHRADTYTVLSTLTGKSVTELMNQNGMQTLKDARESVDGDLLDFFR